MAASHIMAASEAIGLVIEFNAYKVKFNTVFY